MSEIAVIDATSPVELGVADEVIAGLKGRLVGLKADTHAGYEMVRAGIAEVTKYRTGVIKSGKELKADAIAYQKNVNAEVNRVVGSLLEIETPLREEKASVDDEAERRRKEKEEAERLAIESKERAERQAREAKAKAEWEAEEKKRQAEAARLADERKTFEAERKQFADERRKREEVMKKERQKVADDREEIEAEKRAVEEKARKECEAALAAEREAQEKEERAKEAKFEEALVAIQKLEDERLAEERKPDMQKLVEFAGRLQAVQQPEMCTDWGRDQLKEMLENLDEAFGLR